MITKETSQFFFFYYIFSKCLFINIFLEGFSTSHNDFLISLYELLSVFRFSPFEKKIKLFQQCSCSCFRLIVSKWKFHSFSLHTWSTLYPIHKTSNLLTLYTVIVIQICVRSSKNQVGKTTFMRVFVGAQAWVWWGILHVCHRKSEIILMVPKPDAPTKCKCGKS